MTQGPLGGPRPLADCDTAIVFEFNGVAEVGEFGIEPVKGLLGLCRGCVVQRTRHTIKSDFGDADDLTVSIVVEEDVVYQDDLDIIAGCMNSQMGKREDLELGRVSVGGV